MKFVRLDYKVLSDLKIKGYNALRSRLDMDSSDPSWVPDSIDVKFDAYSYIQVGQNNFLLIDSALQHVAEAELAGMVFLER